MIFNPNHNIKPISYVKIHAAEIMKHINEKKDPLVITQNGEAKAVLIDIGSYQHMQDAFALLNMIKISEQDIKAGHVQDSDEVFAELENKYFSS